MTHAPCDRLVVAFELDVRPQPKRRPRFGNGHAYTDAKTSTYEVAVALACATEMRGGEPTSEPVALWCLFEQTDNRRMDGDNAYKAIADALNGVAYKDDSQIVDGRFRLVRGAAQNRVSVAVIRANTNQETP